MKNIKYHLALTDNEYSLIINSLNDLRNEKKLYDVSYNGTGNCH